MMCRGRRDRSQPPLGPHHLVGIQFSFQGPSRTAHSRERFRPFSRLTDPYRYRLCPRKGRQSTWRRPSCQAPFSSVLPSPPHPEGLVRRRGANSIRFALARSTLNFSADVSLKEPCGLPRRVGRRQSTPDGCLVKGKVARAVRSLALQRTSSSRSSENQRPRRSRIKIASAPLRRRTR